MQASHESPANPFQAPAGISAIWKTWNLQEVLSEAAMNLQEARAPIRSSGRVGHCLLECLGVQGTSRQKSTYSQRIIFATWVQRWCLCLAALPLLPACADNFSVCKRVLLALCIHLPLFCRSWNFTVKDWRKAREVWAKWGIIDFSVEEDTANLPSASSFMSILFSSKGSKSLLWSWSCILLSLMSGGSGVSIEKDEKWEWMQWTADCRLRLRRLPKNLQF